MPTAVRRPTRAELIALVAGLVALLLSLVPHFASASIVLRGSVSRASQSTVTPWHWWANVGMLLVLAGLVLMALRLVDGALPATAPWHLVAAGLTAAGIVVLGAYLLRFRPDVPEVARRLVDVHGGAGWSGWLLLAASAVLAVFSALAERVPVRR